MRAKKKPTTDTPALLSPCDASCDRSELLAACNALAGVVAKRTTKDVLKCVLLEFSEISSRIVASNRISVSCSRNGAECGQAWFYQDCSSTSTATLAPMVHWRVCQVWDWLKLLAPSKRFGGWPTQILADAYGGDDAEEINARTGCVCCPLASRDTALDAIIKMLHWSYLAPLKQIRDVYRELREPRHRLRKPPGERRKDGTLSKNQNRLGPITLQTRHSATKALLAIQEECNAEARQIGRPLVDFLNSEEVNRICELVEAGTWPDGWDGTEPVGDTLYVPSYSDGTSQPLLIGGES